ncbi:hypothetical protein A6U97_08005 [Agrobacterium tumefaciens]|nr:hypothetical protein A6U97_08005 [Agrobacterium tumefaciens]
MEPIFQNEEFFVDFAEQDGRISGAVKKQNGVTACNFSGELRAGEARPVQPHDDHEYTWRQPTELSSATLHNAHCTDEPHLNGTLFGRLFPNLRRFFDLHQAAVLLMSTRVVGMEIPGEHSIFKFLSFSFTGRSKAIRFDVERFEPRSSLCSLRVAGEGVSGVVHALLRAKPVQQARYIDIKKLVKKDLLIDSTVLVVGGSRGLGEAAAKIASAAGASVYVGYSAGKADAEAVVSEIRSGGGKAESVRTDVNTPMDEVALTAQSITHVWYFASPKIEFNSTTIFDHKLFEKYLSYYVLGLEKILSIIVNAGSDKNRRLNVFSPSSEFAGSVKAGAVEYAAAKAALETYGLYCPTKFKRPISFRTPRLPMMATDQTSNVDAELPNVIDILYKELLTLGQ